MHDIIIIGGGPAGMTAAVYAARKMMDTLIITQDIGGQLLWTRDIENYMGYQYITGLELIAKFEEQVRQFPVNFAYDEATKLIVDEDGTFIVLGAEKEYRAKTVIIASGKRPRRLNVPGEKEFMGQGIGYCVSCDGPLYVGRSVAVVGGGNSAVQAALELGGIAKDVSLIVRNRIVADPILVDKLLLAANIKVLEGYRVQGIYGGQSVEKFRVTRKDGIFSEEIAVEGIFVEIGLDPNSEFARGVVELNEYNEIVVNCRAGTGVPGLYAAGDVTNGPDKQIVIAAGDGAKALLSAYEFLLRRK